MSCRNAAGGPLSCYVEPLRDLLTDRGYAPNTIKNYGWALARLDGWPQVRRLGRTELTEPVLRRIVRSRTARGQCSAEAGQHMLLVVTRLVELGGVAAGEPSTNDRVLADFAGYLLGECGLAPLTARCRGDVVRRFLAWRTSSHGDLDLAGVTVGDVHAFVLGEAVRLHRGSISPVLDSMRSFLRFTFATGVMAADLSGVLPAVAARYHPPLRHAVDPVTLTALLDSCDRSTPLGLRDFAIMTLLVRLGLRASEVALMSLDDIDWRAGELLVHGKGRRDERMPLPADVGEPLVAYLEHGRPVVATRAVFVRAQAPVGALGRNGVVMVPRSASRRAGIAVVGTHRLRHTAATSLLAAGASWGEVSQVLRHTRSQTSAIYASAEPRTLADVVRAWPAVTR